MPLKRNVGMATAAAKTESLADAAFTIVPWFVVSSLMVYLIDQGGHTMSFPDVPLIHTVTWPLPTAATVLYLAMIAYAKLLRPPAEGFPTWASAPWMMTLLAAWNLMLAMASAFMLVGMLVPVARRWHAHGFVAALCDRDDAFGTEDGSLSGTGMLFLFAFVMSKYVELVDTVFIVARRKKLDFLHWFHHSTVLATTWAFIITRFVPGIWFGFINAGVHTLMYHYYYRSACGVKLTYPKVITTVQIVQMVAGIVLTITWTALNMGLGEERCPSPDNRIAILLATYGMYGSYLYLFVMFFVGRYNKQK